MSFSIGFEGHPHIAIPNEYAKNSGLISGMMDAVDNNDIVINIPKQYFIEGFNIAQLFIHEKCDFSNIIGNFTTAIKVLILIDYLHMNSIFEKLSKMFIETYMKGKTAETFLQNLGMENNFTDEELAMITATYPWLN